MAYQKAGYSYRPAKDIASGRYLTATVNVSENLLFCMFYWIKTKIEAYSLLAVRFCGKSLNRYLFALIASFLRCFFHQGTVLVHDAFL